MAFKPTWKCFIPWFENPLLPTLWKLLANLFLSKFSKLKQMSIEFGAIYSNFHVFAYGEQDEWENRVTEYVYKYIIP